MDANAVEASVLRIYSKYYVHKYLWRKSGFLLRLTASDKYFPNTLPIDSRQTLEKWDQIDRVIYEWMSQLDMVEETPNLLYTQL